MHNSTQNYQLYYDTYIGVIFFQEVTVLVMKGFMHHLSHACRQAILNSFLAGNSPTDFHLQ
jgi:hypothetical protein